MLVHDTPVQARLAEALALVQRSPPPKPIRIKGRLLYRPKDVEEWERNMAAAS